MFPDKLISKAVIQIILNNPFFAQLLLRFKITEEPDVPTMATDGKRISYNAEFVTKIGEPDIKLLVGVLIHEIMHVVFLHPYRCKNRDPGVWNEACDYAINPLIKSQGFVLPEPHLDEHRFHGMSEDAIYNILINEPRKPKPCNTGYFTESLNSEEQTTWQVSVQAAAKVSSLASKNPGLHKLICKEIFEVTIDWREVLDQFMQELTKDDYSWHRPNKRYAGSGLYLPQRHQLELKPVVFAVDTSGSIGKDDLDLFTSECFKCLDIYNQTNEDTELLILWCDHELAEPEILTRDHELKPKGGGGTSYEPVMTWLKTHEDDYAGLIYFTDGYCDEFGDEPNIPVLWVVYGRGEFKPPFGEVTYLK
jgi:predicted metal-dependent peptidase